MSFAIGACFLLSALGCGAYLRLARRWQILDLPNERSSHVLPTPHGGGIPALLAMMVVAVAAGVVDAVWPAPLALLLGLALSLLVVGVLDDLRGLPVAARFGVYALCCALAVYALYAARAADAGVANAAWFALLAVPGLLWLVNLYNFMDGIDGIAASQCIAAAGVAGALALRVPGAADYALLCFLLAAAHAGFLLWNWSPARLFMGDAGSVPTGFLLGGLALYGMWQQILPLACWLILLAAFITDATVTLLWRAAKGERVWQAHRSHAYQRLSRAWGGHRPVVLALLAAILLWLAPLATCAAFFPEYAVSLVILAYFPLLLGMAKALKVG
ncbi:glycosyltransferase family 4 protein [Mangrovimicrobium sediminis]|uniref:Glycosyltransferase family 4 protein n=1 Tax=Mangrovimicrobium sediminis TaxID=2562682 RepID=A0A4Z0M1R6_9GAMM|nr:glycosyltransferase family 4 protein [Haliea sp. SAOS-164]TGD73481.1 glycosyltransferase family 4 protein [Haliea sp. SAOS-164]